MGFIMAAAGSAIGLGNIWRFPIEAANNGGAAFVLVYLGCVFFIGLPVMLAELSLGRQTHRNPVGAFMSICPKGLWWLVGLLAVSTGLAILSYYCVIAGWTLGYLVKACTNTFTEASDPGKIFGDFTGSWWTQLLCLGVFISLCVSVVMGGVKQGIERWSKILMPVLLIVLLLLVVRSVTLPGATAGLAYYLEPDFSKVDMKMIVAALGQAFFSMSLGMGTMITYGSYLSRKENLVSSAVWVSSSDATIAIVAGLMVLPALGLAGIQPGVDEGGAGLIFTVLPTVFSKMPWAPYGGAIFATLFFVLLAMAALTSAISLMEVVTAYLVDERAWSRKKATVVTGVIGFGLGVPSALSFGAAAFFTNFVSVGERTLSFLDLTHEIFGKLCLTFGALLVCVFVGWRWGFTKVSKEMSSSCPNLCRVDKAWSFLLKFVCPLAIATILIYIIVDPSIIR
jgi:NSS family neurotransmitter:Na+ symporter